MRCASGQLGILATEPVKARAASSCISGPRACRRRRSALRSRALLSLASDIILKWDSRHTADSTALEPDGSRWRPLHCIRLPDQGRTCTPTATRDLRLYNIGSRTVCLAHTPGIRLKYSVLRCRRRMEIWGPLHILGYCGGIRGTGPLIPGAQPISSCRNWYRASSSLRLRRLSGSLLAASLLACSDACSNS